MFVVAFVERAVGYIDSEEEATRKLSGVGPVISARQRSTWKGWLVI